MKTLIINGNNVVAGTANSTYKYDLPNGVQFKNQQIAVSSVNMFYSWPNISTASTYGNYNNNTYTYTWTDGSVNTVTMPDGFYDVSTLNAYLQSVMVTNTHYLTDSSGDYVYYLEWQENSSRYSVQLNSYAVPSSLPTGYSNPGSWSLPTSAKTPQVTISSSNNFYKVIGFDSGTYPFSTQSTTYSKLSANFSRVPQVTPVSSVIMTCSIVDNRYSIPDSIIYSFAPENVTYGSQITIQPPEMTWVDIQDGQFNSVTIVFLDQDKNRLPIIDTNLVILFSIREKSL
jgi:hypothetical protein